MPEIKNEYKLIQTFSWILCGIFGSSNNLTTFPTGIIRVGSRSSSDVLKERNLNQVRREHREDNTSGRRVGGKRFRQVDQEKKLCETELSKYTEIYRKSFQGILPADAELGYFMSREHSDFLSSGNTMLMFLRISLKPETQRSAMMLADENSFDEFDGDEPEGYFYAGLAEDVVKPESKESVLLCSANDTTTPDVILELLNTDSLDVETTERLARRVEFGEDLLNLTIEQRWSLYLLWLLRLREYLLDKIRQEQRRHLDLSHEYEELRNIEDLAILQNSQIVGMTTTFASKNHKLLCQLRPRVVIIEEAAEIFEAHVVTCLTEHCQHLILIGDHQQLRPNPSVYNLSVKYKLDVSLLERMIEAGVPYNCLSVQHRMRPEISKLFRHIYDGLEDHPSVTEFQNIQGVAKNAFFVDHDYHEIAHDNVHSKVNQHEAEFLVELCLYLLRQGYRSSQITILTTYTGQMFVIRDIINGRKDEFEDESPRVSSVDNFQGKENDIVLLSLVRNNEEENIGFLKTNNRVCVALSRARKGLYIIGNRKMLSNQSPLWKKMLADFDESGCIGRSLPLICSNHQTENLVTNAADFIKYVPNGGCLKKCEHRLECGHACAQMCHPSNHENVKCVKPCVKNVDGCSVPGHTCRKLCHELCDSICQYPVIRELSCGHSRNLPCSDNVQLAKCRERCEKTLSCGHRCQAYCSEPCTIQCMEMVKKTDFSCDHENTLACSATEKDCRVPCDTLLACGHPCSGKCGQCIQGRVHVKCGKKCERILICSHKCKSDCMRNCPPCREKCSRRCSHSKCAKKCGEICVSCKEPCEWECEHHKCTQRCGELCNRPRCNEPCKRKLTCGHGFCRGLCGERCICVVCKKNNGSDVREVFFGTEDEEDARFIMLKDCEHVFEYTALDKMMDSSDVEITPKVCPLCKTPIVKSLRYGNVVKRIHHDIDNIKRKILGSPKEFLDKKLFVTDLIAEIQLQGITTDIPPVISQKIVRCMRQDLPVFYPEIVLLESRMLLLRKWLQIYKSYLEALKANSENESRCLSHNFEFDSEMESFLSLILTSPSKTSTRVLNELNLELQRLSLKRAVLVLKLSCVNFKFTLDDKDGKFISGVEKRLRNKEIIEEDDIEKFKKEISVIYVKIPQLAPITEEEKIEIVRAIGLKQGHWFKCPNGHFYAIGECGGAMQQSKCPECDAVIGGQQHRLVEGNELAPEMDGATFPAWSDQTNMQNYVFED